MKVNEESANWSGTNPHDTPQRILNAEPIPQKAKTTTLGLAPTKKTSILPTIAPAIKRGQKPEYLARPQLNPNIFNTTSKGQKIISFTKRSITHSPMLYDQTVDVGILIGKIHKVKKTPFSF